MASKNRLQALREASGLTRAELAARLSSTHREGKHLNERTIRRWERQETPIPQGRWEELSEIFGVSVAHLLGVDADDDNGNGNGGVRAVA